MIEAVDRKPSLTDQRVRDLLHAGRRASGNLSQREAAQRAGISAVYWQKIESGAQQSVPVTTLAAMLAAVEVSEARLQGEGYGDLARAVADYNAVSRPGTPSAEEYLAATPGASTEEISALQAVWRALRAERTAEPFEQELRRTRRGKKTPD